MKKTVFIIGGGPSLENFSFEKLRSKDTIAVNTSVLYVPDLTYFITCDTSVFRKVQEGFLKKIKTTKVLIIHPNHCALEQDDGRYIHHKSGFVYDLLCMDMIIKNKSCDGIGFSFDDFRTGYNSGFCAFQLAVLLGYVRICFLGIDLNTTGKHHYDSYKGSKISFSEIDKFYHNFVLALKIIKEQTAIEVISCSSISRLNSVIPYIPFKEII